MILRRFFPLLLLLFVVNAAHAASAQRARSEAVFRRAGFLGRNTPLTVLHVNRSEPVPENVTLSRTRATGPLTFQFSGFSPTETTKFQEYMSQAYARMVQVYGEPAPAQRGRAVQVVFDQAAGDGVYDLPSTAWPGGRIRLLPYTSADFPGENSSAANAHAQAYNNFILTVLSLVSFHGRQLFAYDSWELGFAHAAALVVTYESKNRPAGFDPTYYSGYVLPTYDYLNTPDLAAPIHYLPDQDPNSNSSANLGFFRNSMAQAAWLKVWIENPNFFKTFNAAYYQQAGTSTSLARNIPALQAIAAAQVPQGKVEGLGFMDWCRRQHVLDTAVRSGEKLWLGISPWPNLTSVDTRSQFTGFVYRYRTDVTLVNGREVVVETPIGGAGKNGVASAFNEIGQNITPLSAELRADPTVVFDPEGAAELNFQNNPNPDVDHSVVGFAVTSTATPAPPNQSRGSIVAQTSGAQATGYFPHNVAGKVTAPNSFYGVTLGAENGTVGVVISGPSGSGVQVDLKRGAFGVLKGSLPYPSGPSVKTTFTITPAGGAPMIQVRNSCWLNSAFGGLAVLLDARPGTTTASATLKLSGSNKLRMFSVPLYPAESDEAAALGADPATLFLARYRSTLNGIFNGTQTYGFVKRYDLYPNLAPPMGPGRAYWTKLAAETVFNVRGTPPPNRPFEVPLLGGWNQIGVPFNRAFPFTAIKVRRASSTNGAISTETLSWNQAISRGWLMPGAWRWQPVGGFDRMDAGDIGRRRMNVFEGYYVFTPVDRGVTLIFEPNAPTRSTDTIAPLNGAWTLNLRADTAKGFDDDNVFGAVTESGGALPVPAAKPPMAARTLTLSFLSGGSSTADSTKAGNQSGWADSFLPIGATPTWRFTVDGVANEHRVTLSWNNGRSLPVNLRLVLVDEETSERVTMVGTGAVTSHSFVYGTTPRRFRIEGALP